VKLDLSHEGENHRLGCVREGADVRTGWKREEVTGCFRKLHVRKRHNLYSLSNVVRLIE
jgi:hypothetical protein